MNIKYITFYCLLIAVLKASVQLENSCLWTEVDGWKLSEALNAASHWECNLTWSYTEVQIDMKLKIADTH